MSDDLERLIDARARAIIAEEKAAAAAQEAAAERTRQEGQRRDELLVAVKAAREALAKNMSEPATLLGSWWRSTKTAALLTLCFALFPGTGLMVHMFLIPAIGHSPASVVCPYVCDGCESSAGVFQWNFKGNWHSENGKMGYAFICKNRVIDIDTIESTQISRDPLNKRLQPYMLSSVTVWMLEAVLLTPLFALGLGPLLGTRRRRNVLARRPGLKRTLEELEERLRQLDAPPHAARVYR